MATFQGGIGGGGGGPNVYGRKVAPTAMPDPFGDLSKRFPNLAGVNEAISGDILSKLRGELSTGTRSQIQDTAAQWGAATGMPGFSPGSLVQNRGLRDLGLASEAQTREGIDAYNRTVPTFAQTQTVNPALQAEINSQNNVLAAAPDPTASQSYAQTLFEKYMNVGNPAGGNRDSRSKMTYHPYFQTSDGGLPTPMGSPSELF